MLMSASKGKPHQHQQRHNSTSSSQRTTQLPPQSMFHACQQSSMLFNEFARRNIENFEQRRQSEYQRFHNRAAHQKQQLPTAVNGFPRQPLPTTIRLTMEVQGSDFGSLHNGREAWAVNDSLSAIMDDTNCMILFADQDDPKVDTTGTFNQVTVIGKMPNIDTAMGRIRDFAPITIAISLKNVRDQFKREDLMRQIRQWCRGSELGAYSKVQFSILHPPNPFVLTQNENANCMSLVVRGSRKNSEMISEACGAISKLLFPEGFRDQFFAALEIPASQRRMLVGSPEGVLISAISSETKVTIHFPSSDTVSASCTYLLSGTAASIIRAIRLIQDISPVRIEFEAEHSSLRMLPIGMSSKEHREIDMFDNKLGVVVQLRKSAYEGKIKLEHEEMRHTLTLMSSEENLSNIYQVRKQLLDDPHWKNERLLQRHLPAPRFLDYLKVLVMESSVRAYIGDEKVISVCRCNSHQHGGEGSGGAQAQQEPMMPTTTNGGGGGAGNHRRC